MSSPPPSPFASLIQQLNAPGLVITHETVAAFIHEFFSAFRSLTDYRNPPDVEFEAVFQVLRQAVELNAISTDAVHDFVREYSISSRTRCAKDVATDWLRSATRVTDACARVAALLGQSPSASSSKSSKLEYALQLATAKDVLDFARHAHGTIKEDLRMAEEHRLRCLTDGIFDNRFRVESAPPTNELSPSTPPTNESSPSTPRASLPASNTSVLPRTSSGSGLTIRPPSRALPPVRGAYLLRSPARPLATIPPGVPPMTSSSLSRRKRDAEPACDESASESSNVFCPPDPLLVGDDDGPFTDRQTTRGRTGLLRHVSKRRRVDSSPPPEPQQGPSSVTYANTLGAVHDDRASRTPIREDPPPPAEVDKLQQGGGYQLYESKFVQPVDPSTADTPERRSRVELFGPPESASDQEKSGPSAYDSNPFAGASSSRAEGLTPRGLPLDIRVAEDAVTLKRLLASYSAPNATLQHPGLSIHVGALRAAHSTALSREVFARADQRWYEEAEVRITSLPFGTFCDDVGHYDPVLQRESIERLCVPPASNGMQFTDASRLFRGSDLPRAPAEVPDPGPAEPSNCGSRQEGEGLAKRKCQREEEKAQMDVDEDEEAGMGEEGEEVWMDVDGEAAPRSKKAKANSGTVVVA